MDYSQVLDHCSRVMQRDAYIHASHQEGPHNWEALQITGSVKEMCARAQLVIVDSSYCNSIWLLSMTADSCKTKFTTSAALMMRELHPDRYIVHWPPLDGIKLV